MADAADSKSAEGNLVRVQVPFPAVKARRYQEIGIFFCVIGNMGLHQPIHLFRTSRWSYHVRMDKMMIKSWLLAVRMEQDLLFLKLNELM